MLRPQPKLRTSLEREAAVVPKRKTDRHLPASMDNPANSLARFQQTVGNQAVQRMLGTMLIQAKLTVNQPGDQYEEEADRVADRVMRVIESPGTAFPESAGVQIHRRCAGCDEEEKQRATKRGAQKEGGAEVAVELEAEIQRARGNGQPLDAAMQRRMESAFGADFSGVRIHADSQADTLNLAVNAVAFTSQQDIFFRHGAYNPDQRSGRELLAHELTHVVQQKGAAVSQKAAQPVSPLQPPVTTLMREPRPPAPLPVPTPAPAPAPTPAPPPSVSPPASTPSCTVGAGIPNTVCSAYAANSWWLPNAYVVNATCACSTTPNTPEYMCVRKFLQDRLAAAPASLKTLAASKKSLESSWNPLDVLEYKGWVIDNLTPVIYRDHVDAYRSCCCPSGPAAYPAWVGVTTVPLELCALVEASIAVFGSCHGTPGRW